MNAFEEKMRERQEGREEGREEGLAEGERIGETRGKSLGEAAKQQEIARKMLEEGLDLTLIQKITGLTRKKIQSL